MMNNYLRVYFYENGDSNSNPVCCCTTMSEILQNHFVTHYHGLYMFDKHM